jgi:hypothetical protein
LCCSSTPAILHCLGCLRCRLSHPPQVGCRTTKRHRGQHLLPPRRLRMGSRTTRPPPCREAAPQQLGERSGTARLHHPRPPGRKLLQRHHHLHRPLRRHLQSHRRSHRQGPLRICDFRQPDLHPRAALPHLGHSSARCRQEPVVNRVGRWMRVVEPWRGSGPMGMDGWGRMAFCL